MKLFKKVVVVTGMTLLLSSSSLLASSSSTYTVQKGDTLMGIVYKLGFNSLKESEINISSGNNDLIFVGEELAYKAKKKKKSRFKLKNTIDLKKFCFKDNRSIHYRASERCTGKEARKQLVIKKKKKSNSSH
ncbi:MAG: LysM domain-containing protein [Campylobacterota bacterium]|nr:LysM domain-containing protein [Campylobacterota bacterium]